MIACLLLFDQTAETVGTAVSISFGIEMVLFMILLFFVMWVDMRHDSKHWKLDRELRQMIWDTQTEFRKMVYDAKSELRKEIRDSEQRSREALEKLRAPLTPNLERELMSDAEWALLLARGKAQLERIERRKQPQSNAGDAQQAPEADIDAGLKELEQTIANLNPPDATLQRILEKLKDIRKMQRRTKALLEGE